MFFIACKEKIYQVIDMIAMQFPLPCCAMRLATTITGWGFHYNKIVNQIDECEIPEVEMNRAVCKWIRIMCFSASCVASH